MYSKEAYSKYRNSAQSLAKIRVMVTEKLTKTYQNLRFGQKAINTIKQTSVKKNILTLPLTLIFFKRKSPYKKMFRNNFCSLLLCSWTLKPPEKLSGPIKTHLFQFSPLPAMQYASLYPSPCGELHGFALAALTRNCTCQAYKFLPLNKPGRRLVFAFFAK